MLRSAWREPWFALMNEAALACRIGHVVRARAGEKVIRAHALAIITAMAYIVTFRDGANVEFVAYPVRRFVTRVNVDYPIPITAPRTHP